MPRRFILLILLLNYALSAIAQYDEIRRPTTECPDNQITQVYDNQIICVDRETGACTGLAWGVRTSGPCAPCGYYNYEGSSPNQNCCESSQIPMELADKKLICVKKDYSGCLSAKQVYTQGSQQIFNPGSGICSQAWLIDKSKHCLDSQIKIQQDNKTSLEACYDPSSQTCFTPLSSKQQTQTPYEQGSCKPCQNNQKLTMVDGAYFCVDVNTHTCYTKLDPSKPNEPQALFKQDPCDCNTGQNEYRYPSSKCPKCTDSAPVYDGNYFCQLSNGDCLTVFKDGKQSVYNEGACAPCGNSNPNGCCGENEQLVIESDGQFCVNRSTKVCSTVKTTPNGAQHPYHGDGCETCGSYPNNACKPCHDGQTTKRVNNTTICVDNSNNRCYTALTGSYGNRTQSAYRPTSTSGTIEACSLCGKYDNAQCAASCLPGQTLIHSGSESFCVNDQAQCKTTLGDGNKATNQNDYKGPGCSLCGKYPETKCSTQCPEGQNQYTINDQTFCTNQQNQCLTSGTDTKLQQQLTGENSPCGTCGLYPSSECPPCESGSTVKTDSINQKQYCLDGNGACTVPNNQNGIEPNTPYLEGDCAPCGKTACCGYMQVENGQNQTFCLNQSDNNCYNLLNKDPVQTRYKEGSCAPCGKFPNSNCTPCKEGQTMVEVNGTQICTDTTSGQCYGLLDANGKQKTYQKSANNTQPCYECGKYPLSACPTMCPSGQVMHDKNSKPFCTDESANCLTTIGNGISQQTSYRDGVKCGPCGKFPWANCPENTCKVDQINHNGFCTDASTKQCYSSLGGGRNNQRTFWGGDDENNPCYPCGYRCKCGNVGNLRRLGACS